MKTIPGPSFVQSLLIVKALKKDPTKVFEELYKTYGPIIYLSAINRIYVFEKEFASVIFKDNVKNYKKGSAITHFKPLLGQGLLSSEGDYWKSQRSIMGKNFYRRMRFLQKILLNSKRLLISQQI